MLQIFRICLNIKSEYIHEMGIAISLHLFDISQYLERNIIIYIGTLL